MSIQLSEFQRVNGGDDDLLPMYVTKKEPNIVSKKSLFLSLIGAICFFVTCIGLTNFSINTTVLKSQINDDYFNSINFNSRNFNGENFNGGN
jgi:hypothetical protein